MGKLLKFLDDHILKWGVAFAILFTAWYPKLPSIGINHTWVYIRLEDFVIVLLTLIWFIQLIRKKFKLPFPLAYPIVLYWIVGALSLGYSLMFIGPHLANFFPSIAALQYVRRIEYMILFFIAASTVRSEKDIRDYLIILLITVSGVIVYGFGQRWYILLWSQFPAFFEKYSFCFPSFQTGNEEFAKGIPLCLPSDARITSTFGGHYDLAGFLVLVIPVLFGIFLYTKKIIGKIVVLLITFCATILLILTASRISFVAYLIGISAMLVFIKQKKLILPVLIVSIALLLTFSQSTAKRFLETIRLTSVVTNDEGQIVGIAATNLAPDLQKKISKNPIIVEAPPPSQNLPQGTGYITLPQIGNAPATKTNVAVVQAPVSQDKLKQLNLANGGIEISTLQGTFLVKKALVYDISFTTRFQGEWPNAWNAFLRNIFLGSGFSSISLATDSDYFRTLGETGILGFLSFAMIFMFLGIFLNNSKKELEKLPVLRLFAFGLAGGVIGLFINATFIDVFEASKIAEPLWLLLGIGAGGLLVYNTKKVNYLGGLKSIFTSAPFILIYLFIILGILFFPTISNFFVANDFQWLHSAAASSMRDIINYFANVKGYFYRPLDRLLIFVLYSLSAFMPQGYHLVMLFLHVLVAFGVYIFINKLFAKKSIAFIGALFFLVLPAHGENVYWISAISSTLATLFMIFGLNSWINFREKKSIFSYIMVIIFGLCALLSYELAVVFPLLLLLTDLFFFKQKKNRSQMLAYLPFIIEIILYGLVRLFTHATWGTGEYTYNFVHIIQNVCGNIFGYVGLFIAGEHFLPLYNSLRAMSRPNAIALFVVLVALIITICIILWKSRKKISYLMTIKSLKLSIYGLCFGLVALIPVLPLGHIAERYFYLGSIGFIILVLGIVDFLADKFVKEKNKIAYSILVCVLAFILAWCTVDVRNENQQWEKAGEITRNTLVLMQTDYNKIRPNAVLYLYLVNPPVKFQNAWVFSSGLEDAMWFVYREEKYIIFPMKTIEDAKANRLEAGYHPVYDIQSYFLVFDKNGKLSEVQP